MTGNNFKEKKVVSLIFMQFWSRSHLNKLDRLTPQDVYWIISYKEELSESTNPVFVFLKICCLFWNLICSRRILIGNRNRQNNFQLFEDKPIHFCGKISEIVNFNTYFIYVYLFISYQNCITIFVYSWMQNSTMVSVSTVQPSLNQEFLCT